MDTYKKTWIIIGLIILIVIASYIFFSAVPKHRASRAIDGYMENQNISQDQINTREIMKDWKNGGYVATIVFKDDPKLIYEYSYDKRIDYPYHIFLNAYKNGSGQTEKEMKHPPMQQQLDGIYK